MKKIIFIVLLISFYNSFSQNSSVNNYWPKQPILGDTLNIESIITLPTYGNSGPNCGVLVKIEDTVIGNQVQVSLFFDICYTTTPPAGCFRIDTAQCIINQTGISSAKVYWNVKGTICVPFSNTVTDSTTLNFSTTNLKVHSLDKLFSAFPNPANNQLTIKNPENIQIQGIQFWDLKGKLVKKLNFVNETINVSELMSGIYFVKIETEKGVEVLRVMKQ